VEGTRSADNQEAVRTAHDNFDGIFSTLEDCFQGSIGYRDFGYKQLGWNQRILSQNCVEEKGQSVVKVCRCIHGGVILRVSSVTAGSMSKAGILYYIELKLNMQEAENATREKGPEMFHSNVSIGRIVVQTNAGDSNEYSRKAHNFFKLTSAS
jgi:hypothetical protein